MDLSLEQAYTGRSLSLSVERVVLNPECPIARCNVCYGIGKVSAQNTGSFLSQRLTSPCPACNGMGLDLKSCQLLKAETKVVTVDLPPGSRPGYQIMLTGQGHEVVENLLKEVGDLEVVVSSVDSGNFRLFEDRMELTIVMSVMDALQVNYLHICFALFLYCVLPGDFLTPRSSV